MENKRVRSNWYIATTHWLTSEVIFIGGQIIFWGIFQMLVTSLSAIPYTALRLVIVPTLAIWLAVRYSSHYINKKYVINDKNSIVKISTSLFVGIPLVFLLMIFAYVIKTASVGTNTIAILGIFIMESLLYYFLCKKYIS